MVLPAENLALFRVRRGTDAEFHRTPYLSAIHPPAVDPKSASCKTPGARHVSLALRIHLHIAAFGLILACAAAHAANPVLKVADPHAAVFEKAMWVYATGGGRSGEFYAWSSRDFRHWEKHGPVLRLDDVPWIDDDGAPRHMAWAPCAIGHDGRYYFYYSVGPQNPTPSRIGVAVADSPAGPFKDSGKP
ncbi:MAG: family 43 glycosylhydrolase, partial [Verrucomicrobiae bacterium]|nr:family 43 glycosylhydrolase [Verrucomicrobiae bacterium]